MKAEEIIKYLESWSSPSLQESYDNCGVICGDVQREVDSALLTLDVTEEVVEEAKNLHCKLIIAHHPILFKPIKSLTG